MACIYVEFYFSVLKHVFPTNRRISSNNFSGKIPDFIKNLKKLEKL